MIYNISMEYKWLNRENNEKLIVFFNGWGMDECVVNHLQAENYDVLMFYDYNRLETDFDFSVLNAYSKKYLIAWSMGVYVSNLFYETLKNFDKKIAIAGRRF